MEDSDNTPSARILNDMRGQNIPFFRFAMNQAMNHRQSFLAEPLNRQEQDEFITMSEQSVQDQLAIENTDSLSFDEYLAALQKEYEQPGI